MAGHFTGIRIWRPLVEFGSMRSIDLYVDEQLIGDIPYDDSFKDVALKAGEYSVYVKMDWCKSKPTKIIVSPNSYVSLKLETPPNPELSVFLRRNSFFQLVPSPPGPGIRSDVRRASDAPNSDE